METAEAGVICDEILETEDYKQTPIAQALQKDFSI